MIRGAGIDIVNISAVRHFIETEGDAYLNYTFTAKEVMEGKARSDPAAYFAARFAVKEAVFKAAAHLLEEKTFDMRVVETLQEEDGYPYVHINPDMKEILQKADISRIHVSISDEDDYAAALAIAEKVEE